MDDFAYERFLIDQLIRPMVNLYRVTPLAAGETPAGPPVAYVRQKRMKIREDIRFFADEQETRELFRIAGRSILDTGGSRYDVVADGAPIATLHHVFGKSLLRSTWRITDGDGSEIATAHERSKVLGVLRRAVDFVPEVGGLIPIPYNFDLLVDGEVVGTLNRKFQVRDTYVLDLSGDGDRRIDRRVAIALAVALDTLQNR